MQRLLKLMGSTLQPEVCNETTSEIRLQYPSAEKARRILGWRPLFKLDEGLCRTIDWYKDFFATS
jgi:CDP-glucose 4,6-dehydratase